MSAAAVLPARESEVGENVAGSPEKLVNSLNQDGRKAFLLANLDQVLGRIDHSAVPETSSLLWEQAGLIRFMANIIEDFSEILAA